MKIDPRILLTLHSITLEETLNMHLTHAQLEFLGFKQCFYTKSYYYIPITRSN